MDPYLNHISELFLSASCRALGLFDHNPMSPTVGCGDRGFWHYRDGKGYAVGSFQVAMLGMLGAASAFPDSQNAFSTASDKAQAWWAKQIIRHGTLDEYFVGQKSFCATAYTTMAAAVCALASARSGIPIPKTTNQALSLAIENLTQDHCRPQSANQSLAARLAWDIVNGELFPLLPNPFEVPVNAEEGWPNEYGGIDLGYSLKCLDLCALALSVLKREPQRSVYLKLAATTLSLLNLMVVDYTFSPALGSRGNPHLLLGGLRIFANSGIKAAHEILREILRKERFPFLVTAATSDDKYLCFFHLTSLLLEFHSQKSLKILPYSVGSISVPSRPCSSSLLLRDAGIYFYRAGSTRVCISLKKAAVYIENNQGARSELGYLTNRGTTVWGPGELSALTDWQQAITIHGDSVSVTLPLVIRPYRSSPFLNHQFFRGLLTLLLKTPFIRAIVRQKIYDESSTRKKNLEAGKRIVLIQQEQATIRDTFSPGWTPTHRLVNWVLTDGHCTRLFGNPAPTVSDFCPSEELAVAA